MLSTSNPQSAKFVAVLLCPTRGFNTTIKECYAKLVNKFYECRDQQSKLLILVKDHRQWSDSNKSEIQKKMANIYGQKPWISEYTAGNMYPLKQAINVEKELTSDIQITSARDIKSIFDDNQQLFQHLPIDEIRRWVYLRVERSVLDAMVCEVKGLELLHADKIELLNAQYVVCTLHLLADYKMQIF